MVIYSAVFVYRTAQKSVLVDIHCAIIVIVNHDIFERIIICQGLLKLRSIRSHSDKRHKRLSRWRIKLLLLFNTNRRGRNHYLLALLIVHHVYSL